MALNKKPIFLFCLLVVTLMAVPKAKAQLGLVNGLLGLIKIQGTVFCTLNGNMGLNATSTSVFSNALVQLQCGPGNAVVSTATTNASGIFSILLDPLQFLLSTVLADCRLAVTTPLAACNAALPSAGSLLSALKVVETTVLGLLNITTLGPIGFGLVN